MSQCVFFFSEILNAHPFFYQPKIFQVSIFLLATEFWHEFNILCRNKPDTKFFQDSSSVHFFEQLDGRYVAQAGPAHAVEIRHRQGYSL